MKIAIVKYGMGNVASVQKALKKIGFESTITSDHNELCDADLILLPGVGSFKKGMENLNNLGLVELLTEEVLVNKKPFIGICLGMQLIASFGNEPVRTKGLGWIDGEVVKIKTANTFSVPHLGWNNVDAKLESSWCVECSNQDFYFIHSYHFVPTLEKDISLKVSYDGDLVAGVQKDNIFAFQFHPEKSQEAGLNLLNKIIQQFA